MQNNANLLLPADWLIRTCRISLVFKLLKEKKKSKDAFEQFKLCIFYRMQSLIVLHYLIACAVYFSYLGGGMKDLYCFKSNLI